MKLRVFVLLSALLLAIMASVSHAQLDPCLGLSASDCALINEASSNTLARAQSFFQDWSIDFSVSGVPGSGPITFNATGSGPVVLDMMNADLPLKFDQSMNVSFNDGTSGDSGPVQARIVDGVLYVEFGQGWRSLNLTEAINNPEVAGQLPLNADDLLSGDISGLDAEALGSALPALLGLVNTPGFLNYSRSGADFTFVADLGTLLKASDFSTALMGLSGALDEQGQQIAGIAMVLPMLLSEGKITVVQTVDEAAKVITGLQFLVNAAVNAGMLSGDSSAAPIVIDLKFTVQLSRINEAFDIVAPESAEPLDLLPISGQ